MTSASEKTSKKETTAKLEKKPDLKIKNKKSLSPLLITTSICALSALVLSFYNANKLLSLKGFLQQSQIHNHNSQQQVIAYIEKRLITEQEILNKKITTNFTTQQQKISALTQSFMSLSLDKRGDSQSWQLEKTAYLLSMAQLTLKWEKSIKPTIELLSSADTLIKNLNNPNYVGLRQTLSNEISALESLPVIDTIGLLSKISALNHQLQDLPIKSPLMANSPSKKIADFKNNGENLSWENALQTTANALSKIIIIRKNDNVYQTLISQKDKKLIIQELHINLKLIEWAVLQKNIKVYQLNIEQAKQALQTYFDENSSKTKYLLKTLTLLKKTSIAAPLPDISRSYQQLTELMKLKTNNINGGKI